jgi:hypothetical protein
VRQIASRLAISPRALLMGLMALVIDDLTLEAKLSQWWALCGRDGRTAMTHGADRATALARRRTARTRQLDAVLRAPDGPAWVRTRAGQRWLADTHTRTGAERLASALRVPLTWDDPEPPARAAEAVTPADVEAVIRFEDRRREEEESCAE